jgi:hypothetical protein
MGFQKDWAENFMMQLMVDDLDGWWEHIEALDCRKGSESGHPKVRRCSRGDCV